MGVPGLDLYATVSPRAREVAREADDDFFCLRYEVWYPSRDCAVRTKFKTCGGCLDCDQGRFNLKRHHAALRRAKPPVPPRA